MTTAAATLAGTASRGCSMHLGHIERSGSWACLNPPLASVAGAGRRGETRAGQRLPAKTI